MNINSEGAVYYLCGDRDVVITSKHLPNIGDYLENTQFTEITVEDIIGPSKSEQQESGKQKVKTKKPIK